jgi:hypothetical protein
VPPNQIIEDKCKIDTKFISEHILEQLSDYEYRSLTGKSFKSIEHEIHLVGCDKKVFCSVLSSDIFYTAILNEKGSKKSFKRNIMSNCLDTRFFEEIVNEFL